MIVYSSLIHLLTDLLSPYRMGGILRLYITHIMQLKYEHLGKSDSYNWLHSRCIYHYKRMGSALEAVIQI